MDTEGEEYQIEDTIFPAETLPGAILFSAANIGDAYFLTSEMLRKEDTMLWQHAQRGRKECVGENVSDPKGADKEGL
jgi:hypothetical protein